MMPYWATLQQTVAATLKTGRIGSPVFVRCTASMAESPERLMAHFAQVAGSVNAWLADSAQRVYALGPAESGHLSVTLTYRSGRSAVLTVASAHDHPQIDLAILGSKGAIYHREQIDPVRDGSLEPRLPDQMDVLVRAVKGSLATGQVVSLSDFGGLNG